MKKLLIAVSSILWCLGLLSLGVVQAAEKYPVKQILFIVPVEAGGCRESLPRLPCGLRGEAQEQVRPHPGEDGGLRGVPQSAHLRPR